MWQQIIAERVMDGFAVLNTSVEGGGLCDWRGVWVLMEAAL